MTARVRLGLFLAAGLVLAVSYVAAVSGLPRFGGAVHPYGDRAIAASLHERHTANAVGSVSFDQRGFDTLGEEFILVLAVLGVSLLLRPQDDEVEDPPDPGEQESDLARRHVPPADVVRMLGSVMLPITLAFGCYLVAHGHLSPGGGFQGGVVLATAIHLVYLAGDYPVLERIRSLSVFEGGEALGASAYAAVGLIGLAAGSAFLANTLPYGELGALLSAGTVPLLNVAVGVAVTSGVMVLLGGYLAQTLVVRAAPARDPG